MVESEAIRVIKMLNFCGLCTTGPCGGCERKQAKEEALSALEEIQQYRAIGTVEECREAREKQSIKKPYWRQEEGAEGYACPCCDMGVVDANGIRDTYCHSCGQHLDWSDTD